MLHRLRDTRALSLFLFSASLWSVLTYELGFQDHLLDRATSALAGLAIQVVLLGLSLVALFVVALAPLTHALTHRQAGTLLFAILCLGLGIVGGFGDRPWFGLDGHFPLLFLVLAWLPGGIIALCVGVGLCVTGVKGLQARHGPLSPAGRAPARAGRQRVQHTQLVCDAPLWCCVHPDAGGYSRRCGSLGCQPLAAWRCADLRSHP